ncbi:hypothetical protein EZS27_024219, partial [termite gut metagenome]
TYLLFVLLFILWKPLFMWFHHDLYAEMETMDYFEVMLHGLPLDFSVAGYFSIPNAVDDFFLKMTKT